MSTLLNQINKSQYYFYFLAIDKFLDINLPQIKNFCSVSPWSLNINLRQKNSGQLLSHPKTKKYIEDHTPLGFTPAIIPFKPSAKVEHLCRQCGWKLIANPAKLNRFFEDKIKFSAICDQYQIPQIPHLVKPFSQSSFRSAQQLFGQQLVIQSHFGWAGNSTHFASKHSDLSNKIPPGVVVKYSPKLDGYSLLNNCCLVSNILYQSPPGLQYTGLPEFTSNPYATVGRQWPAFVSEHITNSVSTITKNFASILSKHNYRGYFGLDFFVHQNKVLLLECNPRLTASFAFYTKLELAKNLEPLLFYHLAEFSQIINQNDLTPQDTHNYPNIQGSELTPRNSLGQIIKKYHSSKPLFINPEKIVFTPKLFDLLYDSQVF